MKCLLAAALVAGASTSALAPAWAQSPQVQVPAIEPVKAAAAAASAPAKAADPPPVVSAVESQDRRWPPGIQILSPSAPLGPKERHGIALARRWSSRHVMPALGPHGEVRFRYGATMPTVVCAPLQICNIGLQPGEVVNKIDVGDPVMWTVTPGLSGSGAAEVTHLIIKPADAGLHTVMDVETNRRTYAIRLVSTRHSYMPLVAFSYPDDQAAQWAAYQQQVGYAAPPRRAPSPGPYLMYAISGDDPAWRPIVAYSDWQRTYIEFPPAMAYGAAPVLEALRENCGLCLFRSPAPQVVNYRQYDDPAGGIFYIYNGVLDHAELISGVGRDQTRVLLTRAGG